MIELSRFLGSKFTRMFVGLTGILMITLLVNPAASASSERYATKNHSHPAEDHVPSADRNFYVPLAAEVNVTPQRFRRDWFQGVFSTSGVELGGHEPVWFTGAVARFDVFPGEGEPG